MDNTKYSATMTLTQEGTDGEVSVAVSFEPRITPEKEESNDEAPAVFAQMAYLFQVWLESCGIIDEDGNISDIDEFTRRTEMDLRSFTPRSVN